MTTMPRLILPLVAIAFASSVAAQTTHDHAAMHSGGQQTSGLSEPGQGAFAALAEVVMVLRSDPSTDWSKVDIGALRAHLVDMDNLVTRTSVETSEIDNGLEMQVSLGGDGGDAARRMVPAHAPVLAAETGWSSTVTLEEDAVVWRVSDPKDAGIIRALGFYGLMALGDHHRVHHLGIATGAMAH